MNKANIKWTLKINQYFVKIFFLIHLFFLIQFYMNQGTLRVLALRRKNLTQNLKKKTENYRNYTEMCEYAIQK